MKSRRKIKTIIITAIAAMIILSVKISVAGFVILTVKGAVQSYKQNNEFVDNLLAKHAGPVYPYALSNNRTFGYGGDGRSVDYETFYGITLETDGKTLTCIPYDHTGKVMLESVSISKISHYWDESDPINIPSETGKASSLDLSGMEDGMYIVRSLWNDPDDPESQSEGFIYIDNGEAFVCRGNGYNKSIVEDLSKNWTPLVESLNPADYLDGSRLCYPAYYFDGKNIDGITCSTVDAMRDLSDQIITNPEWSDSVKVYAMVKYMISHYAYDTYVVEHENNAMRGRLQADPNCPTGYLPYAKTGVCRDFTNMLAVMCRHQGIPCTSVEPSHKHVLNLVYMNGEWASIDIAGLVSAECTTKDMDSRYWSYFPSEWDYYYGKPMIIKLYRVDRQLWKK